MKHSKMGLGIGSALVTVLAAVALSGCTSGTKTATNSAAGGEAAPSGSTTAATATGATSGASARASSQVSANGGGKSAAAEPACTDTHLKVATTSDGSADGHAGLILVVTNTGGSSCSVQGYPGADVTDQPGDVVLSATRLRTGYLGGQYPSPATVVLAPGAKASTVIEWLDAPPNGETPVGANCPGMDDGWLLITPPNTHQAATFSAPGNLCAGFEVHPLVPGSTGRAAE